MLRSMQRSNPWPSAEMQGNPCLMGIDLGAGSLKTMIVGLDGGVLGTASADIASTSPQPGWSEQDPKEWWHAVCATVPLALSRAGIDASAIKAVSFSAGAHTPVLEGRDGRLLRPAILWNDQRSGAEANELQAKGGEHFMSIALNRPSPTWTAPQLLWLARHEPQVLRETHRLYVAKDWLRSRLTGTWETDPTEAAGTLLFDVRRNQWSVPLCDLIGWDPRTLPPIVAANSVVGAVTPDAAAACGLRVGTPVVCGTSDTSIETFGVGSVNAGDGTIKLATAATVSIVGESPHVHPTLINYPLAVPGLWYTITGTNSCASAHRWLRDRFFAHYGSAERSAFEAMDAMAAATPPGALGLLFHPYLQGERAPHWDPLLRADFIGMTFRHEPRHFVRALYEGIAFSLRDVLEQFRAQGMDMRSARIAGGGAKSACWRQIVADVLGVAVLLPRVTDASFGAALLAGVGVGLFANERAAAQACTSIVERAEPDTHRSAFYEDLFGLYRRSQLALAPINHALGRLPVMPVNA
jgi:xylulokinase